MNSIMDAAGRADTDVDTESPGVRVTRAELASEWWTVALRGALAIVFGVVALAWPGAALGALALLFGVYALADGIMAGVTVFRTGRPHGRWWPMALEALAGIAIGVIAIIWPAMAALTLVAFIGAWALITGVLEIAAAVRLRREIDNEWLLGLAGVLSVLFGLFAILAPATAALALVWVVGAYAIMFGAALVALGWRLRAWRPATAGGAANTTTTEVDAPEPIDIRTRAGTPADGNSDRARRSA
jgi:uncharacterized membrane protein HdeD (DUF308 family)